MIHKNSISKVTHGYTLDKEKLNYYKVWSSMKQRCLNKKSPSYKYYGARGISICTRWLESFENFAEDMGHRPPNTELDRINNNDNYYPENCRWVSHSTNLINRNSFNKLNLKGVKKRSNGKYQANIVINKKSKYIGTFDCPLLASVAYNKADFQRR